MFIIPSEIAAELIAKERNIYKGVSANVDFYSGFVYKMLGLIALSVASLKMLVYMSFST